MILPTKHIKSDRALISIGGDVLGLLNKPKTMSRMWDDYRYMHFNLESSERINYEWFILAIDLLFVMEAVYIEQGVLHKARQ